MEEKKQRPFNFRQKEYKKNRLIGMNQYNAAKAAGYSEKYARNGSHRIEKYIKVDMAEVIEQARYTGKVQAENLVGIALVASDIKGHPDYNARLKADERLSKLSGRERAAEVKIEHSGNIEFFEGLVKRAGVSNGEEGAEDKKV